MKIKSSNSETIISNSTVHIKTIDMHTGGEPLRVVLDGYPEIKGDTVLKKRAYCKSHLDHLRKLLMFEPRGHADMYGCLVVEPNDDKGDFGVIFMHNEGYSTMCGHATIAIAKLAVQLGWVEKKKGETKVVIDAPCGRLDAYVNDELKVRFHNVPSFVLYENQVIDLEGYGKLRYDIAYGGAYYGFFEASKIDLPIVPKNVNEFIRITKILKSKINKSLTIIHPYESDLSFLYGCIFIEPSSKPGIHSRNICVFADGEVDRCPTGSGVSARIAIHMNREEVQLHEEITIESVIGTKFQVKAVESLQYGPHLAYIPEVKGEAFITGKNEFILEKDDFIKEGFILR